MPITARQYLLNNPHYPIMLPPGYTTGQGTGYLAKPGITQDLGYLPGYDPRFESVEKYPVYVPVYPDAAPTFGFRMPSIRDSVVKSEDVHRLIPGTSLTKEDLNRKVMQQLMDNKMIGRMPKEPRVPKETEKRASPPQEGILRKSVSFRKEDGELDSGIDSYTAGSGWNYDSQSEPESDNDEKDTLIDTGMQTLSLKDSGVGTDYSLLYNYRPDSSLEERPPWQYWNPTSKSTRPSSAKKSSKAKPFRETVLSAPAEAKFQSILGEPISATSQAKQQALLDTIDQELRTDRAQLEWIQRHPHPPLRLPYDPEVDNGPVNRSGAFNTVDHTVKSDRAHLEWILKQPRPPRGAVKQQGVPAHRKIGSRDMVREAKERAYLEYRRSQVMQLEAHFAQLENGARQMKEAKEERCRKFAADVTRRDVQRQQDSEAKLKSIHNAKRTVSSSIARQQQERSNSEAERNGQRLEALRMRTQRREEIVAQREKEIQDTIRRRQDIKHQRQDDLTRRHVQKLNEENDQAASRETQKRNNEVQRREHYYNKEQKNQEAKDLRLAVREQKMHDLRSQVLP